MQDPKKLVVILGPHRSGTSLYSAAVESLGADLCLPSHYINEENQKGFFEHPEIVEFNDRLLNYLGGSWDNPLFDGAFAIAASDLEQWQAQATALFTSIFADVQFAAVKDPRFCQLLDFWVPVFNSCGYRRENLHVLHVHRDPVEVSMSQQHRALENTAYYEIGRVLAEGAALWLSLSAQALSQSRSLENVYVAYADILASPETLMNTLAQRFGLEPDQAGIADFCDSFVDTSLHRSKASDSQRNTLKKQLPQALEFDHALAAIRSAGETIEQAIDRALEIYRRQDTQNAVVSALAPALSRLSERSRADRLEVARQTDVIHDFERQVSEHMSVVTPLRAQIVRLEEGNIAHEKLQASLRAELESQKTEMVNEITKLEAGLRLLEYTVGEMQASTSWRLTRPLRKLGAMRKKALKWFRESSVSFRLKSIHRYQRLSVRHPRLAWISRVAVRPFFRLLKKFTSDQTRRLQADGGNPEQASRMRYQQEMTRGEYRPFISVIVPNYNHASYLKLRLDSIYSQSYRNYEVILLDDASSDRSIETLEEYLQAHPDNTRLIVNDKNSGGVFHQWKKGLALAKGELIWIAESDDWCSDNFLETLVPYFENEAIQLAYSRTVFMDSSGEEPQWTINEYLHDIDPHKWSRPMVETASNIVRDAFAVKNIIPNVSSAIFRNPGKMDLLEEPQWLKMKTCGDWLFYLHLLRGGLMAYSPVACNYYRIHGDNTSVKSYAGDDYYAEHEAVAKTVQSYFCVDFSVFEEQRKNLVAQWRRSRSDFSEEAFEACYSLTRIATAQRERAPNLLMASYGFCSGGGETFPIELANLMKTQGYNVTYLDCAQEPRNEGVRKNLRADIPVVSDYPQLERIIEDFGIDIVHSHHAWVDSTILDLLPEDTTCKTIVTLHGMYETINYVDLKFILPRLVKRSARLIYVAEKNLSALKEHNLDCGEKLVRIENALSASEFEPVDRAELGIPANAFVLTLVSRALKDKGWQEAVEITRMARELSGKDVHLILVGDGDEYDRLIGEELPDYIHLLGFQRNVRGYFSLADVGILPSKFRGESSPLVIIECLQAGTPFLASALGDIPHMLSGQAGLAGKLIALVNDEVDIGAWADVIDGLASDRSSLEALRAIVPDAASKFDSTLMAKRHDNVYRSAMRDTLG